MSAVLGTTAYYWTQLEFYSVYETYFKISCHLSHEMWYITRPVALANIIMAVFVAMPVLVRLTVQFFNVKLFPGHVSDDVLTIAAAYLKEF
jgi:hypothetical protein